MAQASLVDLAYSVVAGLPGGPTRDEAARIVAASLPLEAPGAIAEAIERALALKWSAYSLYADFENRHVSEVKAREALRAENPGFSESSYSRAWADGRLGNV